MSSTMAPPPLPAPAAFHVALTCRADAVAKARELTVTFLKGLSPPLTQDTLEEVVLVVSELVTNAVRHAGSPTCSLRLSADPDVIAVAVRDGSPVPPLPRNPDVCGEGGGFGWSMVSHLATSTSVTVEPGGKTVNAVLPRRAAPE
ncbi:ATP-binding protein [Streptomyces sp. NPDC050315]|uniref:ATP-binding protein n=1 Tax=Streptomyces sp. NPDC050315 TaxID=3155039 RepID=UPI003431CDA1